MQPPQIPLAAHFANEPNQRSENTAATSTPSSQASSNTITTCYILPRIEACKEKLRCSNLKRKIKGEFETEQEELSFNKLVMFIILIVVVAMLAIMLVCIGLYHHPSPDKIEQKNDLKSVNQLLATPVLTATIPLSTASTESSEEIHVAMVDSEKLDSQSIKARSLAPPYLDPCKVNDNCDWGYRCHEGLCHPGCDSDSDCRKLHKCGHWKHDGPSDNYCMVQPHKTCRAHLEFCVADNDCCSGLCKSKGKWKMCQPSRGRNIPPLLNPYLWM